jgi:hypothetical protein
MLPTLNGRIQTRVFVLAIVGGAWTLLITPVIGISYATAFVVLLAMIVLGTGWEFGYHVIQQFRWEKDWPTLFGLITAINEGALLWLLLELPAVPGISEEVSFGALLVQFLSTWILVWLVVNGPMRVPFIRWRFRGGRLV